ncbi:MAG: DUF3857 and transglutaminase domain-containing protein [Bacteroidetes bacterium]|nr:DUF3857 and transglutaminase domain-containing protein [Bacteroidota bacterium]
MKRFLTSVFLILCTCPAFCQEELKIKFGKINPEDFKTIYPIDSNAHAVVIADIGSTKFVGNNKGGFSLVFKRFRRMQILNKNAFNDAKVEIGLYTIDTREEQLNNLKAVTYNLENGKVVETKLDKSEVFKEKLSKNLVVKKFTFPNLREGSIIEYQYDVNSDFIFNLQPWQFQGEYPCLWSEYTVSMPEFYKYISLTQGYQPYYINTRKDNSDYFSISDINGAEATQHASFNANVTDYRWVMKDVPAIREESFTSTIQNHMSKIEFQLAALAPPFTPKNVMASWSEVCQELLNDEDFGYALGRDNPWLNDVMADAKRGAKDPVEMAKNIFEYVRNNMTCTSYDRRSIDHPLKNVLKSKNGSEAEINLLLTVMLQKAGLKADPVILSTRHNGYTYSLYPLLNRFNYVITKLDINGTPYFLDASHSNLGFNKLTADVYNVSFDNMSGHARTIDKFGSPVDFIPDSLLESSITSVIIINDEKNNLTGRTTKTPGYFESYSIRNKIKDKGREQYFSNVKKTFNTEVELLNQAIDSLNTLELPVTVSYDFTFKTPSEDILYFNPMLTEITKENPFKSATRRYPVEMPFRMDETYLFKMDIPAGYVIDELPKPVRVRLNDNEDSYFEYVLDGSADGISLRSRIKIDRTTYSSEEYEILREFFNIIVKKQAEQIVFKKKK